MAIDTLAVSYEGLLAHPQDWHKSWTENVADYNTCAPHVCCGWMDLHSDLDYGVTPEAPHFWIRPLYWDEAAVLVATDDDHRFYLIERTAERVCFNGIRLHGLVPRPVGEALVRDQTPDTPLYQMFEQLVCFDGRFRPKLVWDWTDAEGTRRL